MSFKWLHNLYKKEYIKKELTLDFENMKYLQLKAIDKCAKNMMDEVEDKILEKVLSRKNVIV